MARVSSRRFRPLIKLGSVLVLLFAVAPQVLYLGHPLAGNDDDAVAQAMPGHEHHEQTAAQHANHCHVGPKGCASSDGAIHVASFTTAIEISAHDGTVSALEIAPLLRTFALWQRPERPPQFI